MKRIAKFLMLTSALVIMSGTVMGQEKVKTKKEKKVETLKCWTSMDCESCKAKIEKNIAFEKGVKDLAVDLETKIVTVKYRVDKTNPEKIEKAIKDLGFSTEILKEQKKKVEKESKK